MVGLLPEPEELVGRWWHRWAGAVASYPRHPEAAVLLNEVAPSLGVCFRGLGGAAARRVAAVGTSSSSHRLRLRQRLGLGEHETVDGPRMDAEALQLPPCLDYFPSREDNRRHYFWLAAFFAHAVTPGTLPADPLQADLLRLRAIHATVQRALRRWPGLSRDYNSLCTALRTVRPARRLPDTEAALEAVILGLLGAGHRMGGGAKRLDDAVRDSGLAVTHFTAPAGYRTFLPVPLWGEVIESAPGPVGSREGDPSANADGVDADERRRRATRRDADQARRRDALILNRFETLKTLAEMCNLNRKVEDDDPEGARQAAEDMDEISLTQHTRTPRTRLKLDLELAPPAADTAMLTGEHIFPEWDFRRGRYHPDHCRVLASVAVEEGDDWRPDAAARRRIRAVRRQFEALRPQRCRFHGQVEGEDLDVAALVRSVADRRAGGPGSDRIYVQSRMKERDLAVAILVDASMSTDSWVENRRVLDVEKEGVLALCHGLEACGDEYGVYAFHSHKRKRVNLVRLKNFTEPLAGAPARRLQALRPGGYTRMGAALRYVSAQLAERVHRHRLLLLLSDGKPNDLDHYEGRYGVEDSRRAIREARRMGLSVFGITVDRRARDYFPFLFGRGGYAIVSRAGRLPAALPAIYRQLIR